MVNKYLTMKAMVESGQATDVSECRRTDDGSYVLDEFVEDQDYCDLTRERWIWSIGKHKVSGQILASTDVVYKDNSQYDLLWLR